MSLTDLLAELKQELCATVDETQPIARAVAIRVRAFVVLAHAEFENHIESLCTARAMNIRQAASVGQCLPPLLALALRYADELKGQKVPATDVARTAATCVGLYRGLVKANNGIKRRDLETLLAPLGISGDALDGAAGDFVLAAEALAALRGPAAHVGEAGFQQDVYPSNARQAVEELEAQVPTFEALLTL